MNQVSLAALNALTRQNLQEVCTRQASIPLILAAMPFKSIRDFRKIHGVGPETIRRIGLLTKAMLAPAPATEEKEPNRLVATLVWLGCQLSPELVTGTKCQEANRQNKGLAIEPFTLQHILLTAIVSPKNGKSYSALTIERKYYLENGKGCYPLVGYLTRTLTAKGYTWRMVDRDGNRSGTRSYLTYWK